MARGVRSKNGGSVTLSEEDKVSKLQNLNKVLLKQITELREERASLLEKNEDQRNKVQQQLAELKNETQKLKENLQQSEREKVESFTKNAEVEELLEVERKRAAETEQNLTKELFDKEDELKWLLSRKDELKNSLVELNNRFTTYSVQEREAQSSLRSEKDDLLSQIVLAQKEMEKQREMMTNEFQERMEKMRNENSALQSQLQECEERAKTKRSQLEGELLNLGSQYTSLLDQHLNLKLQWKNTVADAQDLTAQLDKYKGILSDVEKEREQLMVEKEREQLMASIQGVTHEKSELQSELNNCKARISDLLRESAQDKDSWNEERQSLEIRISDLLSKISEISIEHGKVKAENVKLITDVDSLSIQLTDSNGALRAVESVWHELKAWLKKLENEKDALQDEIYALGKELRDAQTELVHQKNRVQELSRDAQQLQERNSALLHTKDEAARIFDEHSAVIKDKHAKLENQYRNVLELNEGQKKKIEALQKDMGSFESKRQAELQGVYELRNQFEELSETLNSKDQIVYRLERTVQTLEREKEEVELQKLAHLESLSAAEQQYNTSLSNLQKDIAGYCINLSKLEKEREEFRMLTCKLKELKQELCSVLKNVLVEEEDLEGALISSVSDMKSSEEDIESMILYVQKLKVFVPDRIEELVKLHRELQNVAAQKQSMEDKYNSLKADLQWQLMVKKNFSWQTVIASTGALAAAAATAYIKYDFGYN